jgi:hypothetical protein
MADERTYGFNRDDATELINSIGSQETWYPEIKPRGNGGGGTHTIWFTIVEVLCPDGYEVTDKTLVVEATWYTGGCSKTPPGANYDGTYNVYDLCNYLLDQVDANLPGTTGRATYVYPVGGDGYNCEPRWIIDDLCHRPECA